MTHPHSDPGEPDDAHGVIERAAAEVADLLRRTAADIRPFPTFPGAFFTEAVEVETEAAGTRDHGCIVVTREGELRELRIGIDAEAFDHPGVPDPVALRSEELAAVDLSAAERLLYGLAALRTLTALAGYDRKRDRDR
ncbi:MAG: hypothetical protein OXG19_10450 [Chloroflexi bacterium]|nr:hypothetical protein [Chloroflexota bacterium]